MRVPRIGAYVGLMGFGNPLLFAAVPAGNAAVALVHAIDKGFSLAPFVARNEGRPGKETGPKAARKTRARRRHNGE
jgi:hypothetical protein